MDMAHELIASVDIHQGKTSIVASWWNIMNMIQMMRVLATKLPSQLLIGTKPINQSLESTIRIHEKYSEH